jgi:eukaryotic-like serine/threonine-protein kinase
MGKLVAHYEILEKLGEGGMGIVYKARDTHLDRFVALKVLPPDEARTTEREIRFEREAKAASALNHPNIVTIYDIDRSDGEYFMAMEYVAGKTLANLIPRKGLRVQQALKYAVQIADALAKAHSAGIVHRDLKPSNIMAGEDARVKVLDFGLAKLLGTEEAAGGETTRTISPRTAEGTIVGTAAYMSPEQAEGKEVDHRSDIFSFGTVLYEMLTGRRAFQGDSSVSVLSAILGKEPAPLGPEIPHDVQTIVTRCLRKDPARRWQNMADLTIALADAQEESESGAAAAALPRKTRIWPWTAAAVFLAVLAWIALSRRVVESPAPDFRVVPLTSYKGIEREPAFAPDGTRVAFSWDGMAADNFDIYVKQIGEETPVRLTSAPEPDTSPAWSPDGRFIAFVRASPNERAEYILVPAIGGPERRLGESAMRGRTDAVDAVRFLANPRLAWSPDGKWLALTEPKATNDASALFLLSMETGDKRRLTNPPPEALGDSGAAFSPDGWLLAFVRAITYGVSDLYVVPLSESMAPAGEPRRLRAPRGWNTTPAWTPGGREIIFSSGVAEWAGTRGVFRLDREGSGEPRREPFTADHTVTSLALSRAGDRLVFARSLNDENIYRIAIPSGPVEVLQPSPVITSTGDDHNPQYSPDGRHIAFLSNRSGALEVWVSDADGAGAVQLTSLSAPITGSPRWSPDGERIVFDSNAEGQFELYTIRRTGGPPKRLTNTPFNEAVASWSRDGSRLYFACDRSGSWQIWSMPAEGGEPIQVTRGGGRVAFEGPDGQSLYFAQGFGVTSLWRVPVQGGEEKQVLGQVYWQNFTPANGRIYFVELTDKPILHFLNLTTGTKQRLGAFDRPLSFGMTISPDGRSMLVTLVDQRGSDLMLVENFR